MGLGLRPMGLLGTSPEMGPQAFGSGQWASQHVAAHWVLHVQSPHWPEPRARAPFPGLNEEGPGGH